MWFLARNPSGYWFARAARQKNYVFRGSEGFLVWVTSLRAERANFVCVFLEFLGVSGLVDGLRFFSIVFFLRAKN